MTHRVIFALLAALVFVPACTNPESRPVSYWVTQLKENDAEDRKEAADMLVKKGSAAVGELTSHLGDEDTVVAMAASDILARIGTPSVTALSEVLKTGPLKARRWAAHALGRIGAAAKEALPALKEAQANPEIKATATEAIERISRT